MHRQSKLLHGTKTITLYFLVLRLVKQRDRVDCYIGTFGRECALNVITETQFPNEVQTKM